MICKASIRFSSHLLGIEGRGFETLTLFARRSFEGLCASATTSPSEFCVFSIDFCCGSLDSESKPLFYFWRSNPAWSGVDLVQGSGTTLAMIALVYRQNLESLGVQA